MIDQAASHPLSTVLGVSKDFTHPEFSLRFIRQFVNDQAGSAEDLLLRRQSQQRHARMLRFATLFKTTADFFATAPRWEILPLQMQ